MSAIPEGIRQPQDHLKPAVQREAEGSTEAVVHYNGDAYTIPVLDEWDIGVIEAFEAGRAVEMLRRLLGPAQWRRFRKSGAKHRELNVLAEAVAEAVGFESAGE